MKILLIVFLLSYVVAMILAVVDATSVVMILAKAHRVYIKTDAKYPYVTLIMLVPVLNVLLTLLLAYMITTDQFMLLMDLHFENMTLAEAARFDAKPTFNTAMEITRNHNQI